MPRQTQVDKVIVELQARIDSIQTVIDTLRSAQSLKAPKRTRKPKATATAGARFDEPGDAQ